jgi:hypothetical protein
MAFPDIVIGSKFDAKGFKQANTAIYRLEKNVKSLAKGFAGVFVAQKVLAFGKASVKAFAADDAAARSLGQTLNNLGLAYGSNVGTVNGFISRLEAQTGVLDDELRPALDRILRATGDVTKSQELLALALDIAAGTGKSVTQVSQSLQKAYLGQTAALGRLGVGLSKAELASGSFEEIQTKLNALFAGQAVSASNSYQGSLNKLTVAANNAKETIGKGLVDALAILSNSSTVEPTVGAIDRIANSIANATKSAAKFIAVSKTLFSDLSFFRNDATIAAALAIKQGTRFTTPMSISSQDTQKADKAKAVAAKKAADAQIKAAKSAAAAKIAADKKAAALDLALKKANSAFDLQSIQIAAALKNTYDKDDRLRLLALQEIENENGEAALKYIEQLNLLTKEQQTNKLNGIKGITETELSSINAILMRDLEAIRISKMSEEDKAAARNQAYAKYNAAISESGGLAEANFYTEKTQAQLLAIAKIAALDDVSNAQTTLLNIGKIEQLDVIKIVQNAQAQADAAKYASLQSYINLLKSIPQIPAITQAPSIGAGGSAVGSTNGNGMGGNYTGDFTDYLPANPGPTAFSPAQPIQPINITVAGSVLNGQEFTQIVNEALLNAQRTGYSQAVAGAIPTP